MGVPVLFSWLASRFDKNILSKKYPYSSEGTEDQSPDALYLDFNGGIHPAVKNDPTLGLEDMYGSIIAYLDSIVNFVQPQKLLFIAIDGVAPCAKLKQQRSRRYKSVLDKKCKRDIDLRHNKNVEDSFRKEIDFNMISPGTAFMEKVRQSIETHIAEMTQQGGSWAHLKVIFSDSRIPGEGEHKIMKHIRETRQKGYRNAIYGLDSDLLFLTLINYSPETVMVRESQEFARAKRSIADTTITPCGLPEYTYLSIDALRDCLIAILNPISSLRDLETFKIFNILQFVEQYPADKKYRFYHGTEEEKDRLIIDFSFICFLLGNDFLPHLPSLNLRENGLESVVMAYKIAVWDVGTYLVATDRENINNDVFTIFLQELDAVEDFALQLQEEGREKRISKFNNRVSRLSQYDRDLEELNYVENKCHDSIRMGYSGWVQRYYQTHFNIKYRHYNEFKGHVNYVVYKFLEGMKWVLLYYQGRHQNWDWTYGGYLAGPTVHDLYEAVRDRVYDINQIRFKDTRPVSPFVQLMAILPPESSRLLPAPLASIMSDRVSSIHYYYPIKLSLSMEGHRYLWECHVKLPPIDTENLRMIVESRTKYISQEDLVRNINLS